uniref:hypothetical protein n=1 Tax=Sandaracinus sp. TaxID=2024858 RepID=UPI0019D46C55|nr:hypothetical protein [Sandaracinus sp.]
MREIHEEVELVEVERPDVLAMPNRLFGGTRRADPARSCRVFFASPRASRSRCRAVSSRTSDRARRPRITATGVGACTAELDDGEYFCSPDSGVL